MYNKSYNREGRQNYFYKRIVKLLLCKRKKQDHFRYFQANKLRKKRFTS